MTIEHETTAEPAHRPKGWGDACPDRADEGRPVTKGDIGPDYSRLEGMKPPTVSIYDETPLKPPLVVGCGDCGAITLRGLCSSCLPVAATQRHYQEASPPSEARGNRPLVAACILAFITFAWIGDSITTHAPRGTVDAQRAD